MLEVGAQCVLRVVVLADLTQRGRAAAVQRLKVPIGLAGPKSARSAISAAVSRSMLCRSRAGPGPLRLGPRRLCLDGRATGHAAGHGSRPLSIAKIPRHCVPGHGATAISGPLAGNPAISSVKSPHLGMANNKSIATILNRKSDGVSFSQPATFTYVFPWRFLRRSFRLAICLGLWLVGTLAALVADGRRPSNGHPVPLMLNNVQLAAIGPAPCDDGPM